jgi:hypothetical protein
MRLVNIIRKYDEITNCRQREVVIIRKPDAVLKSLIFRLQPAIFALTVFHVHKKFTYHLHGIGI